MDQIAQISRRLSISAFEKTRDKMRAKCGLPVSSQHSNTRLISDMMKTKSSSLKRSSSTGSLVSSTASSVVSTSPGQGAGHSSSGGSGGMGYSQSEKGVSATVGSKKSPCHVSTMQSSSQSVVVQSNSPSTHQDHLLPPAPSNGITSKVICSNSSSSKGSSPCIQS